jgi:hypothetical protein
VRHEAEAAEGKFPLRGLWRIEGRIASDGHSEHGAVVVSMKRKDPFGASALLKDGALALVRPLPQTGTQLKYRVDLVPAGLVL